MSRCIELAKNGLGTPTQTHWWAVFGIQQSYHWRRMAL